MSKKPACNPSLRCGVTVQLAPYNTQYERLVAHMEEVGVFAEPNLWDQPVSLAREHGRATPDTPSAGSRVPTSPASGGGAPHSPGSPTGGTGSRLAAAPPHLLHPGLFLRRRMLWPCRQW